MDTVLVRYDGAIAAAVFRQGSVLELCLYLGCRSVSQLLQPFYILNSDALFDVNPILAMTFPGFSNVRVLSDYQTGILFLIPVCHKKSRRRVRGDGWHGLRIVCGNCLCHWFANSVLLGQFGGLGGIWVLLDKVSAFPCTTCATGVAGFCYL